MGRILGIDVGTNSLGLTVRDDSISNNPKEQIVFSSVNLFQSGVGNGKTGEFSFAAERTKSRSQRKLYRVRRYRKWATLELLINEGCCPLSIEELNKWRYYDKAAKDKREYPVESAAFQQWIKLDFDGDGKPDYANPYEIRAELATKQFDFNLEINRHKLGRAMYHIAERRGFKSSKGETASDQISDDDYTLKDTKVSESEKSAKLHEYIEQHHLTNTAGYAMNHMIQNGIRVRASEYQAIRKDYRDEIKYIFTFQKGLSTDSILFIRLYSQKKNEGTIFYKKPLKSQKGQVGKCTLEPSKPRCPESRPEFEEFRAWQFINNIRFGNGCNETLTCEQKHELFESIFIHTKDIKFNEIREWIEAQTGLTYSYTENTATNTINFKDTTKVSACPIIYRFKKLLGNNWTEWKLETDNTHTNRDRTSSHKITYTWEDIWHICYTAEEEEELQKFSDKSGVPFRELKQLYNDMSIQYSNISLKAINNINHFLKKGLPYSKACMLAKLPDIFGCKWNNEIEDIITLSLDDIITKSQYEKKIIAVVNNLISQYKATEIEERQAYKDFKYQLTTYDYQDIEKYADETYGSVTWASMPNSERNNIIQRIAVYYQQFFADYKRDYIKQSTQEQAIKDFLLNNFDFLDAKQLDKLYHHSQIEYYSPAKLVPLKDRPELSFRLLQSPVLSSLRNPMALRVMHTLRKNVNDLIIKGIITEDSRIVIEVTRQLNDANMRWALERYDNIRREEREAIKQKLGEFGRTEDGIRKGMLFAEQHLLKEEDAEIDRFNFFCTSKERNEKKIIEELCTKYRLWIEQGCISIYTGKPISFNDLLDGNKTDIEHTLPYSRSFDDSLANNTVCESYINRSVKKNRMPSELDNYDEILLNIKPWENKVERIQDNIRFWRNKTKKALNKDQKDHCIRQRHLWELELNYWKRKVDTFHMKEIKQGFRNSQLVDTSIIAKYATLFLKSVFSHVEVQKGSTTSVFRKILGIQNENESKDRSNHTHHAVDAYVLTLIPSPALREKILKLYYLKQEAINIGAKYIQIDNDIAKEIRKAGLSVNGYDKSITYIRENIFAIHQHKNQQLTPANKRVRVKGKIIAERNENNNIVFESNADGSIRRDANNHPVPKAKFWATGDCMRGELHEKTYYGAIKIKGEIKYVVRKSLDDFNNWDELKKEIENGTLFNMMKGQFPDGTSLKKALSEGIYMLNKKGERVNKMRHIRCFAPSNASPTPIKAHTYQSKKEYKQSVLASIGDLPLLVKYDDGKKLKYISYHLFDIASNQKNGIDGIPDLPGYKKTLIWKGTMILIYKECKNELFRATNKELSNRLYVIDRFESKSTLNCTRHNIQKASSRGLAISDFDNLPVQFRTSANKLNFLIESIDFRFENGNIIFL